MNERSVRTIRSSTPGGDVRVEIFARQGGGYVAEVRVDGDPQPPHFHDNYEELVEAMTDLVIETSWRLDEEQMGWVPGMPKPIFNHPPRVFHA